MQVNTNFSVSSFINQIIVPYAKEGEFDPTIIVNELKNQERFEQIIHTPLIIDHDKLDMKIASADFPLIKSDGFVAGAIVFAVDVEIQQNKSYDVNKLATFEKTCIDWVKKCLKKINEIEWFDYTYPILIIRKSDPPLTTKQIRDKINTIAAKLILSRVPNTLLFREEVMSKLISDDFGYLETDLYRFSLYGCLIYDRNYVTSADSYIQSHLIPYIAKIRTIQLFLEKLNSVLNTNIEVELKDVTKIEDIKIDLKNTSKVENLVYRLREVSLRALATIEYPKSHTHLADVSEVLRKLFYIDKLQSETEKKIEVLNSILEMISEKRQIRNNQTMTILGTVISVIGVVFSALALPSFLTAIKKLFGSL